MNRWFTVKLYIIFKSIEIVRGFFLMEVCRFGSKVKFPPALHTHVQWCFLGHIRTPERALCTLEPFYVYLIFQFWFFGFFVVCIHWFQVVWKSMHIQALTMHLYWRKFKKTTTITSIFRQKNKMRLLTESLKTQLPIQTI